MASTSASSSSSRAGAAPTEQAVIIPIDHHLQPHLSAIQFLTHPQTIIKLALPNCSPQYARVYSVNNNWFAREMVLLKNSYQEREGSTEVPLTDQELFRLDNRADAIRFYFVANVTDFFKLPQLKNAAGAQLASAPPPPSGANIPPQQPVQPLGQQALDKDPYQELNSIFRELENEVSCSICAEYFTSPMLLGCGHSYCSACIANWNEHCPAPIIGRGRGRGRAARPTRTIPCPICMQGITSQVANRALENISTLLPRLSTAIRDIPVHPPAPIVVTLGPPPINFRSRSRSRKVTNNTGAVPGVITLDDSSSSRSAASRSSASTDPDVIWLD